MSEEQFKITARKLAAENDVLRRQVDALARELIRHHRACCHCREGVDGPFIGEIESLPGCIAYGATEDEAKDNARELGVRILLDRAKHGEPLS